MTDADDEGDMEKYFSELRKRRRLGRLKSNWDVDDDYKFTFKLPGEKSPKQRSENDDYELAFSIKFDRNARRAGLIPHEVFDRVRRALAALQDTIPYLRVDTVKDYIEKATLGDYAAIARKQRSLDMQELKEGLKRQKRQSGKYQYWLKYGRRNGERVPAIGLGHDEDYFAQFEGDPEGVLWDLGIEWTPQDSWERAESAVAKDGKKFAAKANTPDRHVGRVPTDIPDPPGKATAAPTPRANKLKRKSGNFSNIRL